MCLCGCEYEDIWGDCSLKLGYCYIYVEHMKKERKEKEKNVLSKR